MIRIYREHKMRNTICLNFVGKNENGQPGQRPGQPSRKELALIEKSALTGFPRAQLEFCQFPSMLSLKEKIQYHKILKKSSPLYNNFQIYSLDASQPWRVKGYGVCSFHEGFDWTLFKEVGIGNREGINAQGTFLYNPICKTQIKSLALYSTGGRLSTTLEGFGEKWR